LKKELFDWIIYHAQKSLDNVDPSLFREIADFLLNRLAQIPLENKPQFMNLSVRAFKELKDFISADKEMEVEKDSSTIRVKIYGDLKKIEDFNTRVESYGGNSNLSLAIQTYLVVDNSCFVLGSELDSSVDLALV